MTPKLYKYTKNIINTDFTKHQLKKQQLLQRKDYYNDDVNEINTHLLHTLQAMQTPLLRGSELKPILSIAQANKFILLRSNTNNINTSHKRNHDINNTNKQRHSLNDNNTKIIAHPNTSQNLTRDELCALQYFRRQNDLIIVNADKNLGLSLIKKTTYNNLIDQALVKLSDTYCNITNNYRIPVSQQLYKHQTIANKQRAYILDLFLKRYKHINFIRKILKQSKVTWINKSQIIQDIAIPILAKQRIRIMTRSQMLEAKKLREQQLQQIYSVSNIQQQQRHHHHQRQQQQQQIVDGPDRNHNNNNNDYINNNTDLDILQEYHRTVQLTDDKFLYQIVQYPQIPIPLLKGLPKIHKQPLTMRLIMPFNQHLLNNLHI